VADQVGAVRTTILCTELELPAADDAEQAFTRGTQDGCAPAMAPEMVIMKAGSVRSASAKQKLMSQIVS
jgi:hypothetical protein